MTDATTPEQPRTALLARIPALLEQHAGHESWGENDGRLDSVLLAWGLNPTDFMESLLGWGYTIAIEAQARPAVASEHPMTYCEPCSQCRQRLASDTRSVGALDAERLARLTWEAAEDANDYEDYKARLVVAYDAERQGESDAS